ncbi:MAG TPA: hypothetical protein VGL61_31755 [Kofleriaceae bacterium]
MSRSRADRDYERAEEDRPAPRGEPWAPEVEHFRVLESRARYLDAIVERHGADKFKLREVAAIDFVLELIAEGGMAAQIAKARELVRRKPPVVR